MLEGRKNIFIVGIGGIGVSGLARLLRARGVEVSGSDLEQSPITEALAREGIPVAVGHREENLPERAELLIYSAAVPDTNPERKMARDRSIPEMSYAEALGELLSQYELIAVAGTNGKTTTAAMVAEILQQAGLDPSALVGSIVKKKLFPSSRCEFGLAAAWFTPPPPRLRRKSQRKQMDGKSASRFARRQILPRSRLISQNSKCPAGSTAKNHSPRRPPRKPW